MVCPIVWNFWNFREALRHVVSVKRDKAYVYCYRGTIVPTDRQDHEAGQHGFGVSASLDARMKEPPLGLDLAKAEKTAR